MQEDACDEIANLYESYFKGVFCYCAYRLFNRDLAEDAVSAVFLKLVEKYPSLRGKDTIEIRNWLYGTARNVIAVYLREAKHSNRVFDKLCKESKVSPDNKNGGENWLVLHEAMGKLKQRDQDIIALRYFQGLDTASVADVMGMKKVTTRVYLSRAIKKLSQELGVKHA